MEIALVEAKKAFEKGEVPIGALIEKEGQILALGHNKTEENGSQGYHAELVALRAADPHFLNGATIYVTHEPCPMCLGAIVEAGIQKICFGAPEPRWGVLGGVVDLSKLFSLEVVSGVLADSCRDLIKEFFKMRRSTCR